MEGGSFSPFRNFIFLEMKREGIKMMKFNLIIQVEIKNSNHSISQETWLVKLYCMIGACWIFFGRTMARFSSMLQLIESAKRGFSIARTAFRTKRRERVGEREKKKILKRKYGALRQTQQSRLLPYARCMLFVHR